MRQLCEISDPSAAKIFGDALYARGIPNSVEAEDGGCVIWIPPARAIIPSQRSHGESERKYPANIPKTPASG